MTVSEIINHAGIELLIFAVCVFFGLRLVITKDVRIIKKEHPEEIRDPGKYASYAGWIILFLGVIALVMAVISFFNVIAAVIWAVAAIIVMGILWKILYEKYGEIRKDE